MTERAEGLERVGMETGPLAIWLWNALTERHILTVCMDARHANGVLKMMPNKTDRHDARGLAQIVRTGWYKSAQIKSHYAYVNRATLTAREALVGSPSALARSDQATRISGDITLIFAEVRLPRSTLT